MENGKTSLNIRKLKKQVKGITLIALVVTIIVLLILAGIALNLTIGQNGIFSRAQEAVVVNENASIYEQLKMVVVDYEIDAVESKNNQAVIERLKTDGYVNSDNTLNVEKLMGRKMQTGNGNTENGDIYVLEQREGTEENTSEESNYYLIYYNDQKKERNLGLVIGNEKTNVDSNVKITISKTPETEPAGIVQLKVENVEGINTEININEIKIDELNEKQKVGFMLSMILEEFDRDYILFEQYVLGDYTLDDYIEELKTNLDEYINEEIAYLKEEGVESVSSYLIGNPKDELADYYRTNKNGNYTFEVWEILTNKTYEQAVEVTNVDESLPKYYVEGINGYVELIDIENNALEFEEAYIIYEGERIDVTDCVEHTYMNEMGVDMWNVCSKLELIGKIKDAYDIVGTTQKFEIVKDEISYFGDAKIMLRA